MKSITARLGLSIKILVCIGMIFIMGCGTPKAASDPQNFVELQNLVENREFTINFQWAQPLGGSMINLMSNPNHIKFNGDEVDIFLPYFGVRHRGGGYGDGGGIKYDGKVSNLRINENPSQNNIVMRFEGRQDTETLIFNVTLYDNGNAQANVSSSDRNSIVFQGGDVKPLSEVAER